MLNNIHLYTEVLALLVALACAGKLRRGMLIWFLPYMAYIAVTELLSRYLFVTYGIKIPWAYNLMNLISQCFYSYIFYKYASSRTHQRAIVLLLSLFIIYSAFYYLATSFTKIGSQAIAIGGIPLITYACLFFYQYIRNDGQALQPHYTSGAWIAGGVLIFYSGTSLVFSLIDYISEHHLTLWGESLYRIVPRYLSAILYLCISIALITWRKPVQKS